MNSWLQCSKLTIGVSMITAGYVESFAVGFSQGIGECRSMFFSDKMALQAPSH